MKLSESKYAISIYKAMQSCGVEDAMSIMEEGAARLSAKRGKTYAGSAVIFILKGHNSPAERKAF